MPDSPVSPTPPVPAAAAAAEDNTPAIVSYLFGIGLIIAAVMHSGKKTALGAYHLRQALGILLIAIAGTVALSMVGFVVGFMSGIPVIGWGLIQGVWMIAWAFRLALIVLTILGILAAVNREQKPLPVIGAPCQKYFVSLFA